MLEMATSKGYDRAEGEYARTSVRHQIRSTHTQSLKALPGVRHPVSYNNQPFWTSHLSVLPEELPQAAVTASLTHHHPNAALVARVRARTCVCVRCPRVSRGNAALQCPGPRGTSALLRAVGRPSKQLSHLLTNPSIENQNFRACGA